MSIVSTQLREIRDCAADVEVRGLGDKYAKAEYLISDRKFSIRAAAIAIHVDHSTLSHRLSRGITAPTSKRGRPAWYTKGDVEQFSDFIQQEQKRHHWGVHNQTRRNRETSTREIRGWVIH